MTRIFLLLVFAPVLSSSSATCFGQMDAPAKVTNSLGMTLLPIPAGEFDMGSKLSGAAEELIVAFPKSINPRFALDESPRHRVRLTRPFHIAAHEVTVGQFREFVEATSYRTTCESAEGGVGFAPPDAGERRKRYFERAPRFTWNSPGFEQTDEHPVVLVSWEDAQAFCRWLGAKEGRVYRLPTEAEWEYVCRAGATTWFSFGDDFREQIHEQANIGNVELEKHHPGMTMRQWLLDVEREPADPFPYTAPVGRFSANQRGAFDMHGNVWEWCQDRYLDVYYRQFAADGGAAKTDVDPLNEVSQDGNADLRVLRGGSWCNGPLLCRSATRAFFDAPDAACYVGFRVVRE